MNSKDREEAVKWLRLGYETFGAEGASAIANAMGVPFRPPGAPTKRGSENATARVHGQSTATPGGVTFASDEQSPPEYRFRYGHDWQPKPKKLPLACPPAPPRDDSSWKDYPGDPDWFHCGFEGYLENREPSPNWPIGECFYDENGKLVDSNHHYPKCRGTADNYGGYDPRHFLWDEPGGPWHEGWAAYKESQRYYGDEKRRFEEKYSHPHWRRQYGRQRAP